MTALACWQTQGSCSISGIWDAVRGQALTVGIALLASSHASSLAEISLLLLSVFVFQLRCWTEQEQGIIDDTTAMVIYLTHSTTAAPSSAAAAHGSSSLTSSTAAHGSSAGSSSSASSSSAAKDLATRLGTGLRLGKGSSSSGAKQSGSGTGAAAGGLLGYKRS
jgi:hypothetical protein